MTGAVLQLQYQSKYESCLTVNPQVNFFKYAFNRYLNYATEIVNNTVPNPEFGSKNTVNISTQGELLTNIYLLVKLPPLERVNGTYASWCDSLGYALFKDTIDLQINGITIDKLYPRCMDMLHELASDNDTSVLKSRVFTSIYTNAEQENILKIPLPFWFCRAPELGLPTSGADISVVFETRDFQDLVHYDGDPPVFVEPISMELVSEQVFLDECILEQFNKKEHRFIIEQQLFNEVDTTNENGPFSVPVSFDNSCKELLFGIVSEENLENNNYFAYSSGVTQVGLTIDGKHRFNNGLLPESIFRTGTDKYIYNLSFSLCPENHVQPSGAIDLKSIEDTHLVLNVSGVPTAKLFLYAISYRVLTIANGAFALL